MRGVTRVTSPTEVARATPVCTVTGPDVLTTVIMITVITVMVVCFLLVAPRGCLRMRSGKATYIPVYHCRYHSENEPATSGGSHQSASAADPVPRGLPTPLYSYNSPARVPSTPPTTTTMTTTTTTTTTTLFVGSVALFRPRRPRRKGTPGSDTAARGPHPSRGAETAAAGT
jgi:hypothetical protein